MARRGCWVVGLVFLLVSPALLAAPSASVDVVRLWIEVLDAQGRVSEDLGATDLEVQEGQGAAPQPVSILGRGLRGDGRLVVYFDQALASPGTVRRAADALAAEAGALRRIGDVEIVSAPLDEPPELQVRAVDPLVLSERLSRMALTERGLRRPLEIRERTLVQWRRGAQSTPSMTQEEKVQLVLGAVEEEIELVEQRLDQLLAWVTAQGGDDKGLRVLAPVLDGFDLDPLSFYATRLDGSTSRAVLAAAPTLVDLEARARELAATLAASGWTVLPLAMPLTEGEQRAAEYSAIESSAGGGAGGSGGPVVPGIDDQTTAAPGITIRPGKLFGRGDDDEPEETLPPVALDDPMEPLDLLARASGGEVVTTDRALRDALARIGARIEIAYPSRLPYEAGTARIEVLTTRPGLTVRAPRYAARGLPPALADLRLGRVLGGRDDEGDLSLAAVLEVGAGGETGTASDLTTPASLETRLDLHDLEGQGGLNSVDLRLTVAATGAAGERRLLQEVLRDQNLGQGQEWRLRRNVDLPADATAVAVVIEELDGGRWGGRRAAVVRTSGVEAGFLPDPKALALQVPDETLLRGRTRFEVEVYDSAIARVDFLLDDRTVDSRREPPFAARIDLGRTPRRMLLTAVAYNSAGAELGRDSTVLNGGDVGLGVRIVQPTKPQGTGPVDVEAEISVPIERSLDRVLFFWNNEQVATLFSPPFRQRVMIPEDRPVGYVRVVAMLDDGALAEDVVFMNGPDAGERVDVQLVELYVVVTDRDGRPVRGLGPEEFSVREEGVPQNIATFSDAAELPLTLGMAIDSSASMFVKLPRVQRAALRFLQSTFKEQDRAFVVDFDSKPRLVRGTTNDLGRLERSINGLEASGRTALWESVVFSLVQLQGVRGRKALVVFSDGADEDDQFPFRSSLRIAREMGVPIYMILMKKEPQESAARGLLSRSFTSRAQRLAAATGGRVFYAKEYDSLDEVYDEIELELRSQYLLAYYPEGRSEEGGWREVDVDLARRDLKPRTLRGYWQ